MHKNLQKAMGKILKEISSLDKLTKKMVVLGICLSFLTLAVGVALLFINGSVIRYNPYTEYLATQIASKSFPIFAEVIIGCILVDFLFRR